MTDKQYVFIGGLHRSGTSLLHSILKHHPDISGFHDTGVPEDEGQHLQTVFPPAKAFGGPGKFVFHPDAYLDETSPLITDENRECLLKEWSTHWDTRKPVLIEKSPPNLIRSRFFQALFPRSKFIFVVRHPIPVTFATRKWTPDSSVASLLHHWSTAHRILLQDLPHLQHSLLLRYEDMVTNTDTVLQRIHNFIGVSHHAPQEAIDTAINQKYYAVWESYCQKHPFQRWLMRMRTGLTRHFGYSLSAPYLKKWRNSL